MTIGSLVVNLGLNKKPLADGISSAQGMLKGFGSSIQGIVGKIGLIGGAMAGLAGIRGLGNTLSFGAQFAAEAEQAEVAFRTLLGSAESAKKLLGEVSNFASSTPFELPEIRSSAQMLAAFGFEAGQVIPNLKMIGDIAAGTGQPISELAEIFGKARVQGTLFAEDINQLTGRGVPIIGALADQLGVAETEVKKLVSQGRVGFPELQRAFASMAGEGGKFAGLMEDQSKTLLGTWSNLKDNASAALGAIMGTIMESINLTGILSSVAGAMSWIQESVVMTFDVGSVIVDRFGDSLLLAFQVGELALVQMVGMWAHFWFAEVPAVMSWFVSNWSNVWRTVLDFTLSVFDNIGQNIRMVMKEIWDFIASGGRNKMEFAWKPLLDGFHNSITELPDIPERLKTDFEKQLEADVLSLGGSLANDIASVVASRRNEALAAMTAGGGPTALELADPSSAAGGRKSKGNGVAGGGPEALRVDSAEGIQAIMKAANAQSEAKRQYAEAKKQTKLQQDQLATMNRIADAVESESDFDFPS